MSCEYNLHPLCNQQRVYKKTKFNVFGLFCFFCVCAVGIVFLEVESVFISILTSFFALLLFCSFALILLSLFFYVERQTCLFTLSADRVAIFW